MSFTHAFIYLLGGGGGGGFLGRVMMRTAAAGVLLRFLRQRTGDEFAAAMGRAEIELLPSRSTMPAAVSGFTAIPQIGSVNVSFIYVRPFYFGRAFSKFGISLKPAWGKTPIPPY
ncbi:MAG: hypothetical protein M3429_00455 [Verrucomicrobiota bacterium]|nr:hypothetical protein [Verrucomicrobiota bacterium]